MDYYKLSEEPLKAAFSNKEQGLYRMSVSMSTLAIDLLLKSALSKLIKDYVDNDCQATLEDLQKKFNRLGS